MAKEREITSKDNNPPPLPEILAENYAHISKEIDDIAAKANSAPKKVKNDNDLDYVGVVVKDAKAMIKRVDQARTGEKEPHLKAGREIDGFFKAFTERLDKIAKVLTDRASEFQREKLAEERRKNEEEARKRREAEAEAIRKAEEAAAAGKTSAAAKAEVRAEIEGDRAAEAERKADASNADLLRQRTASGGVASARTMQKVRITSIAELNLGPLGPYLDREAVQKAANNWLRVTKGEEKMPGLEVYDDVQATFR